MMQIAFSYAIKESPDLALSELKARLQTPLSLKTLCRTPSGDLVGMGNLASHKVAGVCQAIEEARIGLSAAEQP